MTATTVDRAFSAKEAAEAIGCTYRQLDYWTTTGLLSASIRSARGSGSRRLYSVDDVRLGRLIEQASRYGMYLDVFRERHDTLRGLLAAGDIAGVYLTADGLVSVEPRTGLFVAFADLTDPPDS